MGGNSNNAGHLGTELVIFKAGIAFSVGCAGEIAFGYQQNIVGFTIIINGEQVDVDNMADLNGLTVGGASIVVKGNQVSISGIIEDFAIAGAGLAIDHLCRGECPANCIDFEGETESTVYTHGDALSEDGIQMNVSNFEPSGSVKIESVHRANHRGKDAALSDAILTFDIPCASEITLYFGQYAKGIYLSHANGTANVDELSSLNGTTLGGVMISVDGLQINNSFVGTLTLTGEIANFAIV